MNSEELRKFVREYVQEKANTPEKLLEFKDIEININEEIAPRDITVIKRIIRQEVASILRDIWFKRATWAR
tara:strand:- start:712 stop:924 length:213 start_codon:yes stop_codon:yes gene_type:complete